MLTGEMLGTPRVQVCVRVHMCVRVCSTIGHSLPVVRPGFELVSLSPKPVMSRKCSLPSWLITVATPSGQYWPDPLHSCARHVSRGSLSSRTTCTDACVPVS